MSLPSPLLLWGIFVRALGGVYLLAFASLWLDAPGWIGRRGVHPAADLLAAIRRDFPGRRRFVWFPSLLWANAGDRAQRTLLGVGMAAAACVVSGIESRVALIACWAVLLSFDVAYDMTYPWECALFEAGFLALMLPRLDALPSLTIRALPLPIVGWAFRVLVARILFGFGKTKFAAGARREPAYLASFMLAQPLPTPAGYRAHRLPLVVHRAGLGYMAVVELAAPVLLFLGPIPRLVGAALIVSLMIGIQATGNYGYFNLLIAVLCVPLLDAHASLFDRPIVDLHDPGAIAATVVIAVLAVGWLISLPVNNWVTRNWLNWPGWRAVRSRVLREIVAFYRALSPFRLVHGYGIFPPRIGPPLRWLPVIEASDDGVQWTLVRSRYQACEPRSRPRYFAPRFPRLDHVLFYEGSGVTASGLFGPLISQGHPYRHDRVTTLRRIAARLLEPCSPVADLFEDAPDAPRFVRVRIRSFTAATAEERARGEWWHCEDGGTIVEPMGARAGTHFPLPTPELFPWDETVWLHRARALRSLHAGEAPVGSDVDAFWTELVPMLGRITDWSALHAVVAHTRARFDDEALQHHNRAYRRLALALGARLEPHFLGECEPRLTLPTWFDVGMLAGAVIADGRERYERAMTDPVQAIAAAETLTFERGMLFDAVFRYDTLLWHARVGLRTARAWSEQPEAPPPGVPGSTIAARELLDRFPLPPDGDSAPLAFRQDERGAWVRVKDVGVSLPMSNTAARR